MVPTPTDVSTIAENKLRNVQTGESVEMKEFWKESDAAIFFFRRWGCMFCRLWAKELSEITPTLRANNIRVVGVGVEEVGAKDFVDGKFFDGDLYYVEDRSTYNKLGFKRFNTFSILGSLFWKDSRAAVAKGNKMNLGGDLRGDWVQVGGALFVRKGGSVLEHFVQTSPAEHMPNEDIIRVFGLENEYKPELKAKSKDSVRAWLFEPSLSYQEITANAKKSISSAWSERSCRWPAAKSPMTLPPAPTKE